MINLSIYTNTRTLMILFYEDTNKKYQKSLSFEFHEFKIQKYIQSDFNMEKSFFTQLNEYELFFDEKYKKIIAQMLCELERLINNNTDPFYKPYFYRGKLSNGNKAITYNCGIKYTKQIMKQFYNQYKTLLNELELEEKIIKTLKLL